MTRIIFAALVRPAFFRVGLGKDAVAYNRVHLVWRWLGIGTAKALNQLFLW
jgi:hypothetical protein